jgi:hypothetical protein
VNEAEFYCLVFQISNLMQMGYTTKLQMIMTRTGLKSVKNNLRTKSKVFGRIFYFKAIPNDIVGNTGDWIENVYKMGDSML